MAWAAMAAMAEPAAPANRCAPPEAERASLGRAASAPWPAPPPGSPVAADARSPLLPGAALASSLAAGESQSFAALLGAHRPYAITVEQEGIDVVVDVLAPDGRPAATVNGPLDRWGSEIVFLRPAASGPYRLTIRSARKGVGPGRYRLRLQELPEGNPAERERLDGMAAMTRAGAALAAGRSGSLGEASAALGEARDRFRAAGDPWGEAEATAGLAAVAGRLGRQSQAADLLRAAAALWQRLGQPQREMRAWNDLGLTLWASGELPPADEALARGLALARALFDAYSEADLVNNRCLVLHARGEPRAALGCYRQALALFHRLGEAEDEAAVLNNLGYAYYSLGEPAAAEENYRQALALRRANGNPSGEVETLNNLAVLFRALGELDRALVYYGEARQILKTLDDRRREAAALHNLGVAYAALGEIDRARVDLAAALDLRRATEDRRGEITTLASLGSLARQAGEPEKALPFYRQALDLAQATGDRRAQGINWGYLGEALTAAGRPAEALAALDRSLALVREVGDRYYEAVALRRQAAALAALARPAEALPLLDQAVAFSAAISDAPGQAASLTERARLFAATGRLAAARDDALAAQAALDSVRTRLGNPELQASFLSSRREAAEILVDVLMRLAAEQPGQGFERAALEASERARARSLLDLVRASGASGRGGRDPEQAARRRDLERRLALKSERLQALSGHGSAAPAATRPLEREIEEVLSELDREDIESAPGGSPPAAARAAPEALGTAEIQALLDPGTLLLEYSLGRERSYLWAVRRDRLAAFVLPARAAIESAARAFHEALSRPPDPGDPGRLRAGRALSRMLLGPVAQELGEDRLAIVADGALHYIPFDVLPEPGSLAAEAGAEPGPLLARHETVELPSASVLAAQRRERLPREPPRRLAIVLADPVYDRRDPRAARTPDAAPPASGAGNGETAELPPFGRLRFSRQEGLAIAAAAPPGAVDVELGFAASRDLALSGRLRDYRYVHLAAHGVFDAARPELSGLVLSRLASEGAPREGFVGLRDLYGLDLGAELVVLSGCQTALGRELRGEGLLGLTRAFLYAGAQRVVASLWWVDDQATSELMAELYRGLWTAGLRPAAALRQARLALWKRRRYRDPFYWGAFVLQGDWR